MRPLYRRRRDALLPRSGTTSRARTGGHRAGLHLVAYLPDGVEEAPLIERAAAGGCGNRSGWPRLPRRTGLGATGLLFGYGRVDETDIEQGIRIVAAALD